MQIRQGDYLFTKVEHCVPSNFVLKKDLIVGIGEKSNHKHELKDGKLYAPENKNSSDISGYIQVDKDTEVVHEEHKPVTLEKGTWAVNRQREFDGNYGRTVQD